MAAYTTIDDPSAYFHTQLYTGDGNDGLAITNDAASGDFQADFIWIKSRSLGSQHVLSDVTRGILKVLNTNSNGVEDSNSEGEMIKTVTSNGFTLGDSQAGQGDTNSTDGATYVAWQWKANGSGSSNTDGTINTTATSANTTAGISISTYTGTGSNATIGHGLSSAPTFWAVKPRSDVSDNQWFVCHQGLASDYATDFIHFDTTGAKQDNALIWNDIVPTSSVISLGTKDGTNKSSGTYVCYAWHDVQGYSKFGSYVGNGNADGPFVYTGFAPAYVLRKSVDTTYNWLIQDWERFDKRNTAATNRNLAADDTGAEPSSGGFASNPVDFLSNGFKIRASDGTGNKNADVYIYAAFAEAPFVNSNGVPCNAR